jgi:hypothetical protein
MGRVYRLRALASTSTFRWAVATFVDPATPDIDAVGTSNEDLFSTGDRREGVAPPPLAPRSDFSDRLIERVEDLRMLGRWERAIVAWRVEHEGHISVSTLPIPSGVVFERELSSP